MNAASRSDQDRKTTLLSDQRIFQRREQSLDRRITARPPHLNAGDNIPTGAPRINQPNPRKNMEITRSYRPAETIVIDDARAGQRLDNFLFARFRQLPRGRVYKMLRKGEVRINGGRIKQNYRLRAGDKLRLPPVRLEPRPEAGAASAAQVERIASRIIHQDANLIVIDKPSGMAVHGGSGVRHGVIELLRQAMPDEPFLELVHRLDRATSGCLLLARNRATLNALHEQLRGHRIDKTYLALVAGRWRGGSRRIEHQLHSSSDGPRKTTIDSDGKTAISTFKPLRRLADATLMEVNIETGRTHQIRVQAAEIGHPLLGDDKYGDFELNRQWRKRGLRRLFLHAASIALPAAPGLPARRFTAPLPKELEQVLEEPAQ